MQIRLHRLFNLCRHEFLLKILTLAGIFFLLPLLILALARVLVIWTFLGLLALNLIWFLTYLLGCPSRLRLEGELAEFSAYYEVRRGDHKQLHFTVTGVRQLELRQSAVERLFNTGRIRFRGEAETDPAGALGGSATMSFEIAGIPHFDAFRSKLYGENLR